MRSDARKRLGLEPTLPPTVTIELPRGALAGWPVLIDALRRAEGATGLSMVFGGLIEQIERQTAPALAEPQGLGAVVRDDEGDVLVRYSVNPANLEPWRATDRQQSGAVFAWDDLTVVEVLSEGVEL